ncbi:protein NDR1-like [Mercurialis annua]|uniref:protein NDR1-like n=1 Tax=Mercurialis annua TaxID=3986 RepID=UPI00215F2907|nr:protein NDR1-like [Mercurialis annua]
MPDSGGGCCRCCCSFIFTLGLTALFLWLSLRVSKPKCSLHKFYIPALNHSLNPRGNTSLIFQLRLENTNKDKGVYYDPVNVTFFDNPTRNHSIGNFTITKFHQGHKKKATKGGEISLNSSSGFDQEAVFRAVSNGSAVFRVDMVTSVKYKIMFWKTKRYKIIVGADVNITTQGSISDPKKGVRLKSDAAKFGKLGIFWVGFLFFVLINLL